jgi:hypothetical protein
MPLPIEAAEPPVVLLSEEEAEADLPDLPEPDLSPDALAVVDEPALEPAFGVEEVLPLAPFLPDVELEAEDEVSVPEVAEEPLVPEVIALPEPLCPVMPEDEPVLPCAPEDPIEEASDDELLPVAPDEEEVEAFVPMPPPLDPVVEEPLLSFCCPF